MVIKSIENFTYGIRNRFESKSAPLGSAEDSNNWNTKGDKIELGRGSLIKGTDISGNGKVTGMINARKRDGTEVTFRSRGKKVEYYDTATEDWIEVGSDILGDDADGEDVHFAKYDSPAGSQVWFSSKNSGLFKIMVANPADVSNMASTDYKGRITIKNNRMYLWDRQDSNGRKDQTGLYLSYINAENYTTVSAEVLGSGDGSTKAFNGTLAFKAAGAKRTCFGIVITDGVETFTDDYNGVLVGDAGGTGTINYTTGAWSVTFNAAPANAANNITSDYQWEDSTDTGIADFSFSSPRVAGEGDVFRQDDGGGRLQNIFSIENIDYCVHEHKTWTLNLSSDDTNATNLIFNEKVGIPSYWAGAETSIGVVYVDDRDENDPRIRVLQFNRTGDKVIPISISDAVDLSSYIFDEAEVFEFGDLIIVTCRHKDSTDNNTLWIYNTLYGSWDKRDWWISHFAINNGVLWGGTSISDNVYELLSGWDDDGANIVNNWDLAETDLEISSGLRGPILKRSKKLYLEGEIQADQAYTVYANVDNGGFVEVGTVSGDGAYVDLGQAINVGSVTVGSREIGGGGAGDAVAYRYVRQFNLNLGKFEKIKLRFVATGLGYVSVSDIRFVDIRIKGQKLPNKYR